MLMADVKVRKAFGHVDELNHTSGSETAQKEVN